MNLPHEPAGRVLRDRRKAAGLTQSQLAERAGIAQSYLSRLELGWHKPGDDVQQRLDAALTGAAVSEPAA